MPTKTELLDALMGQPVASIVNPKKPMPPKPITVMGVDFAPIAIESAKKRIRDNTPRVVGDEALLREFNRAFNESRSAFEDWWKNYTPENKARHAAWNRYLHQIGPLYPSE